MACKSKITNIIIDLILRTVENIIKKPINLEKLNFFQRSKSLPTHQDDKFSSLLFPEKLYENKKVCGGARYDGFLKTR